MKALETIVYVDDEPDLRQIAKLALEDVGGLSVTLFENGKDALVYLATDQPDLILLDVMMPEMDGPSTFEALKALPNCGDIPVVFFTAKVQSNDIQSLLALGAVDVLAKPFDPMALADRIRGIWAKHHGGE